MEVLSWDSFFLDDSCLCQVDTKAGQHNYFQTIFCVSIFVDEWITDKWIDKRKMVDRKIQRCFLGESTLAGEQKSIYEVVGKRYKMFLDLFYF